MSNKRHTGIKSKHLLIIFFAMLACIGTATAVWGTPWAREHHTALANRPKLDDPLPGELVMEAMMGDNLQDVRKEDLKRSMTKVIQDYRQKFRQEHFTGYFLTDLDKDGLPELWVKVGNYRDNSKLELYYPMPDGSLRKSETFAEPGHYYVGDDYLVQVVGDGPGYININRISIHNGLMHVENERGIDLYSDPNAKIPTFAEREIRDTSLTNLSTLNNALL